MNRPVLLDLFCGAGGAAMGYHRAGFDVVGVDIAPQPRYPFKFYRQDALSFCRDHWPDFAAVHASCPCQFYSAMAACRPGLARTYPDLIGPTRELLQSTGLPWVIENVEAAKPWMRNPMTLCGHMFGLKLYRHRLFELSEYTWSDEFELSEQPPMPPHPRHVVPGSAAGHWKPGTIISVAGNCAPIALAREAMGIDWMTRSELAESIPPAFTEHIGRHMLRALQVSA